MSFYLAGHKLQCEFVMRYLWYLRWSSLSCLLSKLQGNMKEEYCNKRSSGCLLYLPLRTDTIYFRKKVLHLTLICDMWPDLKCVIKSMREVSLTAWLRNYNIQWGFCSLVHWALWVIYGGFWQVKLGLSQTTDSKSIVCYRNQIF